MAVAQRSSASASSSMAAVPSAMTYENGGRSSSTHRLTRGSRRMVRPFTVSAPVVNMRSSPSRSNQMGATCGRPSPRVVASLAVWGGRDSRKSRAQESNGSDGEEVAGAGVARRVAQLRHGPGLDLADALPGQVEVLAHLLEGAGL